jgi:AbrB family looped-hinge helix DNA binding protein
VATSTVSGKGWIVIPKEIRERYGIRKGDRVSVVDTGRGIYVVPVPADPIHGALGLFKSSKSLTEGLLEDRREELEREERDLPPPKTRT